MAVEGMFLESVWLTFASMARNFTKKNDNVFLLLGRTEYTSLSVSNPFPQRPVITLSISNCDYLSLSSPRGAELETSIQVHIVERRLCEGKEPQYKGTQRGPDTGQLYHCTPFA